MGSAEPPIVPVQRGLTLRDDTALSYLASVGYPTVAPRPFAITTDVIPIGSSGLARIRQTAFRSRLAAERAPDLTTISIVIEGELFVEQNGGPTVRVGPGDTVAFPATTGIDQYAHAPVTRIGLDVDNHRTGLPNISHPVVIRGRDDMGLGRVVTKLVESILDTAVTPEDTHYPALCSSIESAVTALCALPMLASTTSTTRAHQLVTSARTLLYAEDPHRPYTVVSLAAALAFSPQHLRAIFREAGTSPLAEIRKARVVRARRMMETQTGRSTLTREQIAAASGFSSVASMRRALSHHPRKVSASH